MKLITEEIETAKVLVEEKDGKKSMFIEGVFLQGNLKNRNGRFYPVETLEREVARYNELFVGKGQLLGELGHPEGPTVNLDRVSHKIVDLHKEGTNFVGKAKLLETPMGVIAPRVLLTKAYNLEFLLEAWEVSKTLAKATKLSVKTLCCNCLLT